MDSDDVVPCHFLCPISLQLMTDPVTVSTGITYDRHHIHHWLFSRNRPTCPVTNQILPSKHLTPNLTLRRLILSWATHSNYHTTPEHPLNKPHISHLHSAGLPSFLAANTRREQQQDEEAEIMSNRAVDESLAILHHIGLTESLGTEFVDSLVQVMSSRSNNQSRAYAMILLRSAFRAWDPVNVVNARSEIFGEVVRVLNDRISEQATKAALKFLIEVSPFGRNRIKAVEGGAVAALVEVMLVAESGSSAGRRANEMAVRAVEVMCGCAEGRAELVGHAAGMAVVAKKMLRVSHAATDRAVRVVAAVSKYSATREVVAEMAEVGVVAKLCLILQVDASWKSKEKAREVLRKHSRAWRNSPCIPPHLISSFP